MATPRLMGAEVRRKEDPRLITGTSSYVGDLALPGMHYVAFVRSPHAHARIRKIDASAALRRPGVFKVVTGHDIKKLCAPLPLPGAGEGGGGDATASVGRKHYPLSIDCVRHVGEAVAAVIARAEGVAVDAVDDVVGDWEPLPGARHPFAATAGCAAGGGWRAARPGPPPIRPAADSWSGRRTRRRMGSATTWRRPSACRRI